jgi:hypothetical protein
MKKKCANGGIVKKPMTMQEQLAQVRGKVRPGYQQGGPVYRQGSSFSDNPLSGQLMQGIASPVQGPTPTPAQLQPTQNQSALNGIPAKPVATMGATAIQSGSGAINSLGKADYSTGPRQGGFVNEDGTPRQVQETGSPADARGPLSGQIDMGKAMANLSNTERYKLGGSGTAAEASAINQRNDITQSLNAQLTPTQQVQVNRPPRAGIGAVPSVQSLAAPASMPEPNQEPFRRQSRKQGFASGGRVFRDGNTFSDRPLMPEPGNYPQRIANPRPMPRPIAAAQPVKIPLPPPEYPQERVRPAPADTGAPVGTYPGVTGIADAIRNRKVKNAEAADYAAGGMVKFAGPGGPRDDKIPVKVAGAEINVSDGENAVILPAKTAANPAALQAINGIIQATNDGRQPMNGGGSFATGGYPYDGKRPPTAQELYGEVAPAGIAAALTPATWRAAKVVAPPGSVGGGMSSSGTDPRDIPEGGTITNLAPAFQQVTAPIRAAAGGIGQVFADSAEAQRKQIPYQEVQARRAQEQAAQQEAQTSQRGAASQRLTIDRAAPQIQGIAAGINPAKTPEDAARMQNVAANDGMTTTQMGRGFDPTKLTMADGYGMASNAAGKTIAAGPSEYVGADGKPTSRWTDTQQYKDAIARNERDKIRLAEMQAVRLGANPQQALQASQGIAQAAQQSGLAAQQAGQAQQVQQFAIDKAAREQSLIDAWDKAGTPEQKQAIAGQLKIMRGQQDKEGQFDATKGGQTVDPATGQIIDLPPVIFNKSTGQPVQQAQSAQQAVPPADKRTVGQTYQTPKGPMIWRGNGWEAAR